MADLKALLLNGADEAVSVNQRALVEKILARYSGEFAVYRELLQNADDALASTVQIHFRSPGISGSVDGPGLYGSKTGGGEGRAVPDLKTHNVGSILVRNDGRLFRDEDWMRLKKIAEGNPDVSSVGAFGVGWYSLFSLCDDPIVSSGANVMGFYWKDGGDQLFVKTAVNKEGLASVSSEGKPWTSVEIGLREQAPIQDPAVFVKFLTTCVGFTTNIQTISLHLDGHLLYKVVKTVAPSRPIALKPSLASTSPLQILSITSISSVPVQLHAEVSNLLASEAFIKPKVSALSLPTGLASATSTFATRMLSAFSTPKVSRPSTPAPPTPTADPLALLSATLFLRTVSADLRVTPTKQFLNEMLRATKKALPPRTTFNLLFTSKDEFDASSQSSSSVPSAHFVFAGLISSLDEQGKVFVGFPMGQTTGCASSVAARFVSTMERESIDFGSKYVGEWNRELIWAGGVVARTVYEEELEDIARVYGSKASTLTPDAQIKLEERALHLMRFFTFTPSTPSPIVSTVTETSFFTTSKNGAMTLMSNLGPLPASRVRLPNPSLDGFLKGVPLLPSLISEGAPKMISTLRLRNVVQDITMDDVFTSLRTHSLTMPETALCFKWWLSLASNRSYDASLLQRLKDVLMLSVEGSSPADTTVYPLSSFTHFLNHKVVALDMPLPQSTLPFALTRSFATADLSRVFGFKELDLETWTKYVVSPALSGAGAKSETNILLSPPFAEKVLNTLSKSWILIGTPLQSSLIALLSPIPFLPTSQGPKKPSESYFSNDHLFDDLPTIVLPSGMTVKGSMEKMLASFGVRKHVELQMVFTRLLGVGDWSHVKLTKYLVSVRDTLSTSEVERLRKTAWLPKEVVLAAGAVAGKTVRYPAGELYEPTDRLRRLGLPVLEWSVDQKWKTTSDEAKFLVELGLQRSPTVDQILKIAGSTGSMPEETVEAALQYFLTEYSVAGFGSSYSPIKHAYPFVPAIDSSGKSIFVKPSDVFSNPLAASLGFTVLAPRMANDATRLKVMVDPSSVALLDALLRDPPRTTARAKEVFGYLSTQVAQFSPSSFATLAKSSIIPLPTPSGPTLSPPPQCFFSTSHSLPAGLSELFTTIPDFGAASRPFLVAIGVMDSPSAEEIGSQLVRDPKRFFDLCGSSTRYLSVVRLVASNYASFSTRLKLQMKSAALFHASKRVVSSSSTTKTTLMDDEDEDSGTLVFQLVKASELVINDDPSAFRVFESELFQCTQDDAIESLAARLGSQKISQLVQETYRTVGEPTSSDRVKGLKRNVVERTMLFVGEVKASMARGELRHDAEWVQGHLEIVEVRSIELVRTLTVATSSAPRQHVQTTSASARLDSKGTIVLSLASDTELEYFEVATALCKLLLFKSRPNDSLLLMTLLSTSLGKLKQRGFNVDRILNARQAEREQREQAAREVRLQSELRSANALDSTKAAAYEKQLQDLFPDASPTYLRQLLAAQTTSHVENAANTLLTTDYPRRSIESPAGPSRSESSGGSNFGGKDTEKSGGFFGDIKRKLKSESSNRLTSTPATETRTPSQSQVGPPRLPPNLAPPRPAASTPTNTDAIRSNVRKAVAQSRPETAANFSSQVQKTQVKESQDSYCDSTASKDLVFATNLGGLRFYTAKDIIAPTYITSNQAALQRLIYQIIIPIGNVFSLPPSSLHVFTDTSGPLIAFNRNGAIYINFRYYLAWHDAEVARGELDKCLISNYHSIAHEIAHNLVQPHDSEFSFYFSAICEEYFSRMAELITRVGTSPMAL